MEMLQTLLAEMAPAPPDLGGPPAGAPSEPVGRNVLSAFQPPEPGRRPTVVSVYDAEPGGRRLPCPEKGGRLYIRQTTEPGPFHREIYQALGFPPSR
jgi:hypothetical protein